MKKNQGLAVIPLIVVIVLAGVAGYSIFSWVKTNKQAAADKVVAEQRENELKAVLEDAQQEAEENAKKAEELATQLTQTEEAMKLAEEKAKQDAEEKAAMLAELESKLEAEATAKAEAQERSETLAEEIASLESSIQEAREREAILRASLGGAVTEINPKAAASLASLSSSLTSQQDGLDRIKALLANADGPIASADLEALVRSFESGLVDAERGAADLKRDLVTSGDFSSSSTVGQAIADLQQTTAKQRAIVNSLKAMLANSGETIDPVRVRSMIADLEASVIELEQRQASVDSSVNAAASGGDSSSAMAEFQRTIQKAQTELAGLKRQLAESEAAKAAAIARQEELEKLSIEVKYDIDYKIRSLTYARRLHAMYNQVANPVEER